MTDSVRMVLTAINTEMTSTGPRTAYDFNIIYNPIYVFYANPRWVEGIGDIKNGVLPREVPPFDWAPQPLCFSDTSGIVWMWSGNTCSVLGLNAALSSPSFSLSPNPCFDFLNIESATSPSGKFRIEVFSADGIKRLASETAGTKTTLNVNSLSAGIYFLKVSDNGFSFCKKLVKL